MRVTGGVSRILTSDDGVSRARGGQGGDEGAASKSATPQHDPGARECVPTRRVHPRPPAWHRHQGLLQPGSPGHTPRYPQSPPPTLFVSPHPITCASPPVMAHLISTSPCRGSGAVHRQDWNHAVVDVVAQGPELTEEHERKQGAVVERRIRLER
ncbi:unnamed protein product [Arctogadus glacialis]